MPEADRYKYFRIEARELLEGLQGDVLALEAGLGADGVKRALRLAHTLKGAARVVGLADVATATHELETMLQAHQEGAAAPRAAVDAMLARLDAIAARLAAIDAPAAPPAAPGAPAVAGPARPAEPAPVHGADDAFETVRVPLADLETLLAGVTEASVRLDALRRRALDGAASASALEREFDQVDAELAAACDLAQRLRLRPASAIFPALERAVRDAAAQVGKRARFEASGGETRLDGHVLATLRDALLHVVRNAVDHGIEPEAERLAAGKPPTGVVALRVERRGERVAFVVRDDGRGLDADAIRRTALARGASTAEEADRLEPDALARLILLPGFTTRERVTELSGRGVGLDVVRDAVARLKGDVTLGSEPGRGLTLEAVVPLTLASLRTLVVEAGGVVSALPLDAVFRTCRADADAVTRAGGQLAFRVDDALVPFLPLEAGAATAGRPWSIVVLQAAGQRAAIGVDRIMTVADAVVRPLPPAVGSLPLVSGAMLDAEGVPRPLYDPSGLVAAARGHAAPAEAPAPRRRRVLVVDDSLTTRMLEQSILESAGYEVALAADGEEGLARARAERFDVMVVDVEMPGIDGFEVVRRTREDPALRQLPAVLLTSRNDPADRRMGAEVGARAYLVKGEFDQDAFLRTIRALAG